MQTRRPSLVLRKLKEDEGSKETKYPLLERSKGDNSYPSANSSVLDATRRGGDRGNLGLFCENSSLCGLESPRAHCCRTLSELTLRFSKLRVDSKYLQFSKMECPMGTDPLMENGAFKIHPPKPHGAPAASR